VARSFSRDSDRSLEVLDNKAVTHLVQRIVPLDNLVLARRQRNHFARLTFYLHRPP
jgi:hypothetical protein